MTTAIAPQKTSPRDPSVAIAPTFIRPLDGLRRGDVGTAGGKGANLGEMIGAGLPVPTGFVVTVEAFDRTLEASGALALIRPILAGLTVDDPESLAAAAAAAQHAVRSAELGQQLRAEVQAAYRGLAGDVDVPVAVRSSATSEDAASASFAGMFESYLNVSGVDALLDRIRDCWASAFGARVLFYRVRQSLPPEMSVAVVVQRMVPSLKSGIIFTADPATHDTASIVIEATRGLGESIVQGRVTPERHVIEKLTRAPRIIVTPDSTTRILTQAEVDVLTTLALRAEEHFGVPQDIEFAIDESGIHFTQTRPITTLRTTPKAEPPKTTVAADLLLRGLGASPGIASGPAHILLDARATLNQGEVLVAQFTSPDWVPLMKRAAAIVTESGGMTSHAAIVSRELGVPCVVGAAGATTKLRDGLRVTVDGNIGEISAARPDAPSAPVTLPAAARTQQSVASQSDVVTATRIYVNLDAPEQAESVAARNVDGVGLLRAEFMLLGALGGQHPAELLASGKRDEIVNSMAASLTRIAKAFHPRPVVYRAIDFRSNEFRALRGGEKHEPQEANPMIGYRGCFRYTQDKELFGTELLALYEVRKSFDNLHLMIPFVRTAWELQACVDMVHHSRLRRLRDMQLWIMAEVPSVIWRMKEYAAMGVNAVSIGSNDLTQLILGVDRDSATLAPLFDERDAAVLAAIREIISGSHAAGLTVSICGQAPSVHPEYAEFLVNAGIDSISVVPDAIERTRLNVARAERRLMLESARRSL